jgi:glycosyltransferase involved in cell wall biosynthesis
VPVYKGADLIGKALECLQQQTFGDFEAIISVDGGDEETAAACRPFLSDPRFRMIVHPERLDWVGNFNWLLKQDLNEFFCYRQHDDITTPDFFDVLLGAADKDPRAAAIYCDCKFTGISDRIDIAPSIEGDPLYRMVQYIEHPLLAVPLRGLIRRDAIRKAGPVRPDEFRAAHQVHVWLAKLLHWGNFKRVAKPLYYRLDHPRSFSNEYSSSSDDRKRASMTTLFTGLLEAAMPLCRTPEERQFFQQAIVDQFVAWPMRNEPSSAKQFMNQCRERLRFEGNTQLFPEEELPPVLHEFQLRLNEIKLSRMQRMIYRIRRRARMGRLIYPRAHTRRILYQIRHLAGLKLGRLMGGV